MYQKINYSLLWIFYIGFLIVFSACKDKSKTYAEESSDTSSTATTTDQDNRFSEAELKRILGDTIGAKRAIKLIGNYLATLNSTTAADDAKSVYFTKEELDAFAQVIIDSNLCDSKSIGFRFYFAKYDAVDTTTTFDGKNTIVIRATCNGKDIPHQIEGGVEKVGVAYDFGDVCPPRCNLAKPDSVYTDGRYNPEGNCKNCPE